MVRFLGPRRASAFCSSTRSGKLRAVIATNIPKTLCRIPVVNPLILTGCPVLLTREKLFATACEVKYHGRDEPEIAGRLHKFNPRHRREIQTKWLLFGLLAAPKF